VGVLISGGDGRSVDSSRGLPQRDEHLVQYSAEYVLFIQRLQIRCMRSALWQCEGLDEPLDELLRVAKR
jgi:hypothetical protein